MIPKEYKNVTQVLYLMLYDDISQQKSNTWIVEIKVNHRKQ